MTATFIRHLSETAVATGPTAEWREAARRTGGAPVYADLGGVLAVGPEGSVWRFDPESERIDEVRDEKWITLALFRAARMPNWRACDLRGLHRQ